MRRRAKEGNKQDMIRTRRGFMAHLRRIYKEDKAPEMKELRIELKKRHMEFYIQENGRKTIVLVHRVLWGKSKSPQGRDWPDYYVTLSNNKKDRYETLLVWSELLGKDPEATAEMVKAFVADEKTESGGIAYIQ